MGRRLRMFILGLCRALFWHTSGVPFFVEAAGRKLMPKGPDDQRNNKNRSNDLAVLQQILALNDGQLDKFQPVNPPSSVRRFLARASLEELQGTLVEVLSALRRAARDR